MYRIAADGSSATSYAGIESLTGVLDSPDPASALFDTPMGLALDEAAGRLYVAVCCRDLIPLAMCPSLFNRVRFVSVICRIRETDAFVL